MFLTVSCVGRALCTVWGAYVLCVGGACPCYLCCADFVVFAFVYVLFVFSCDFFLFVSVQYFQFMLRVCLARNGGRGRGGCSVRVGPRRRARFALVGVALSSV